MRGPVIREPRGLRGGKPPGVPRGYETRPTGLAETGGLPEGRLLPS